MLCDVNSTNMQSNQRISPNFKIKYLYNKDRENYAVNCAFISKTVKMVYKSLENCYENRSQMTLCPVSLKGV